MPVCAPRAEQDASVRHTLCARVPALLGRAGGRSEECRRYVLRHCGRSIPQASRTRPVTPPSAIPADEQGTTLFVLTHQDWADWDGGRQRQEIPVHCRPMHSVTHPFARRSAFRFHARVRGRGGHHRWHHRHVMNVPTNHILRRVVTKDRSERPPPPPQSAPHNPAGVQLIPFHPSATYSDLDRDPADFATRCASSGCHLFHPLVHTLDDRCAASSALPQVPISDDSHPEGVGCRVRIQRPQDCLTLFQKLFAVLAIAAAEF